METKKEEEVKIELKEPVVQTEEVEDASKKKKKEKKKKSNKPLQNNPPDIPVAQLFPSKDW
jgi:hypothetical protein